MLLTKKLKKNKCNAKQTNYKPRVSEALIVNALIWGRKLLNFEKGCIQFIWLFLSNGGWKAGLCGVGGGNGGVEVNIFN